jgi:hypothetical protein
MLRYDNKKQVGELTMGARALVMIGVVGCSACGGPTPQTPSTMRSATSSDRAVKGPAYAQYNPASQTLTVYVFDAKTSPAPGCGKLGSHLPSFANDLNTGGYLAATVDGKVTKPEKKKLRSFDILLGDRAKGNLTMSGDEGAGVSLDITKVDASGFQATFVSEPSAKDPLSGDVFAVFCSDQ